MQLYEDDFEDILEAARSLLTGDDEAELWEANELVNRALSMRPDDPEAWILKAQVLSALDDDVAALAAIEMAAGRQPSAEALYWKAAFLSDLERFSEALRVADKALRRLGPADDWLLEDLYCEKATALEALGRHAEAVATYEAGLEQCPTSTLLLAGLDPLRRKSLKASLKVLKGGLG